MSEAARTRRDDARQGLPAGRDGAAHDPLAELARLVGQDDPFRRVFQSPAAVEARVAAPAADRHPGGDSRVADGDYDDHARHGYDDPRAYDDRHVDDFHGDGRHAHGHDGDAHPQGYADEHGYAPPLHGHGGPADDGYGAHDDQYYAAEQAAHRDEAGFADGHLEPAYPSDAALPDAWAAGSAPEADRGPAPAGFGKASSARRPLAVLAAVLALTGGGLAASFLAKGSAGTANVAASGGSRGAPTIMAASGPTKVKVEDSSATAPEDQDAALLNKGAAAPSGPVKIVTSEEQPVDLGQLPKSSLADGARPLPPAAPSPFPEPKRVKTFVVHPDGTMLSADGTAPAAPDAVPATPKTAARGGTTPKGGAAPAAEAAGAVPAGSPVAANTTIASLSADPPLPGPAATAPASGAARQPGSPGARPGGGYGLQLASSPVEADANAAFAKLKKKFPAELGSLSATVHKADTGDKPVYRVRVGSMSQDEAKALCTKLQGAGGSCFVVHN